MVKRVSVFILAVLLLVLPAKRDGIRDAQWHLSFMHIEAVHRKVLGEGVLVAVIDTGVDANHPDLRDRVVAGADLVNPVGDGRVDSDGHGTAMAGLIAGDGKGGKGILGIAPRARILPVRIASSSRAGAISAGADGIRTAVARGAQVICFSAVVDQSSELWDAVAEAIAADVVMVAGVGNRPYLSEVGFPAAYAGVIAAAGVDREGNQASISVEGPQVSLAAPGTDIISTSPGGWYATSTGTSNATALIAGAAALVRSHDPGLSADDVQRKLIDTAIDKGPAGRDVEYGYGIVNVQGALSASLSSASAPKPNAERLRSSVVASLVLAMGCVLAVLTSALLVVRRRARRVS